MNKRDRNYYMDLPNMQRIDIKLPGVVIQDIEEAITVLKNEFNEFRYGSLNHFILVAIIRLLKEERRTFRTRG